MLNKDALKILQGITNISNSAILSYPITTIMNDDKDMLCNIDFSILDDDSFTEFGIMDLSSFLNALSVLDNPKIEVINKEVMAKDSNSQISFLTSRVESVAEYTTNPNNITALIEAPSIVDVKIDTVLIGKIRKGASVFKSLKDLFIIKNDEGVFLKTGNKENFVSRSNSYQIKLDTEKSIGANFEIAIPIANFLALPNMEYTLKVKWSDKVKYHKITVENEIFQFVLSVRN